MTEIFFCFSHKAVWTSFMILYGAFSHLEAWKIRIEGEKIP